MKLRLALALALVCCSSLQVRGGRTVRAGDEPRGTSRGAWVTADCRDARGGVVEESSRVFLVERKKGKLAAVEARPAYDSIVIENTFQDGNERVFQAAFTDGDPVVLREVRLPLGGEGPGRLVVARSFTAPDPVGGRFRATYRAPAFTCRLDPLAPVAPPSAVPPGDAGAARDAGAD